MEEAHARRTGSYVNGTWSDLAPMHWTRRYYASAVLNDGRVFVSGGEYSNAGGETNKTEIYDPVTDTWTEIDPPPGWGGVGDAPCAVLPDGRVLIGHFDSTQDRDLRPRSPTPGPPGRLKGSRRRRRAGCCCRTTRSSPSAATARSAPTSTTPAGNTWVNGGTLPGRTSSRSRRREIGAGVLLNDGRAFFAGATNHTALYTPPAIATDPGTWTAGPDFPNDAVGPDRRLQGHAVVPADQRHGARRGRARSTASRTTG